MKLKTRFYTITIAVLVIVIILITISCCRRNITGADDENEYWNHRLLDYSDDNIIMNGKVTNGNLYLITRNGLYIFSQLNDRPRRVGMNSLDFGFNTKPVFSKDGSMIAHFDWARKNRLFFAWSEHGRSRGTEWQLSSISDKFVEHNFQQRPVYNVREFGAFINNRFVALIGHQLHSPHSNRNAYVVWADLGTGIVGDRERIRVLNTGYWRVPSLPDTWSNLTAIYNFQDKVFIAVQNQLSYPEPHGSACYYIVMSEDGQFRHFRNSSAFIWGTPIANFFEYQGYLVAELTCGRWWATKDGENWWNNVAFNIDARNHTEIEDYVVFNFLDNIIMVGDSIYNASYYRLPTDNLKGHTITSFNKFNGDLVITTSHGIFYKPWVDVLNDKIYQNTFNVQELQ